MQKRIPTIIMAALVAALVVPVMAAPMFLRAAGSQTAIAADAATAEAVAWSPEVLPVAWPEEAALLLVGSALIGLGAAVRRSF